MTKDKQIETLKSALRFYADGHKDKGRIAGEALAVVESPDQYGQMIAAAVKAYEEFSPLLTAAHKREQRRSFLRGMCPSHWDYEAWCGHVDKWCDENGY